MISSAGSNASLAAGTGATTVRAPSGAKLGGSGLRGGSGGGDGGGGGGGGQLRLSVDSASELLLNLYACKGGAAPRKLAANYS